MPKKNSKQRKNTKSKNGTDDKVVPNHEPMGFNSHQSFYLYDGHRHVKVNICFTAIGMLSMPIEEESREQTAELTEPRGA